MEAALNNSGGVDISFLNYVIVEMFQANVESVLRGKAAVGCNDCTALVEGHAQPCYLFYELVFADSFPIEEK